MSYLDENKKGLVQQQVTLVVNRLHLWAGWTDVVYFPSQQWIENRVMGVSQGEGASWQT